MRQMNRLQRTHTHRDHASSNPSSRPLSPRRRPRDCHRLRTRSALEPGRENELHHQLRFQTQSVCPLTVLPPPKLSSALQMLRGGSNHVNKSPSPVPLLGGGGGAVSRLENSSASRVLTEELHKQQGQENTKLKALIAKEVRKMGKSK